VCRANVVLSKHLEHSGARETRHTRKRWETQRQDGEEIARRAAEPLSHGDPIQPHDEDEDQDWPQHERGNGHPDERAPHQNVVGSAVVPESRQYSHDGSEECCHGE